MKRNFIKLDRILQGWLDEHKQKRSRDDDQDFMDVMLQVIDHEATKDCSYDADTINKATCLVWTSPCPPKKENPLPIL